MDSDPDIVFIEKDSGMSSLGGSETATPENIAKIVSLYLFNIFDCYVNGTYTFLHIINV